MSEIQKRPLVGRIAGDDAELFAAMYERCAQVLYNLSARALRSSEEAENAVTEVFVSAWRESSGLFDPDIDPADLLLASTRNLVIRRRRARSEGRDDRPVDLDHLAKKFKTRIQEGDGDTGKSEGTTDRAIQGAVSRCGSVTAAVLSRVYFSGLTIWETASVLSLTSAECRSRLHGCLDMIASGCGLERPARQHGEFSVHAAAHALGAFDREECPEFLEHLDAGCEECASDISRFSRAAGKLSYLLPDVKLAPALEEKILFSLQLARVVSANHEADEQETQLIAGAMVDMTPSGGGEDGGDAFREHAVPDPGSARRSDGPVVGSRSPRVSRVMLRVGLGACTIVLAAGVALYTSSLHDTIDLQNDLIESVHTRNTELLLQYNKLAGVSEYFESEGLVAILEGNGAYPGLTGKLVWDTAGSSAMLQILNLPPDLEESALEVSTIRDGRMERVVGLRPAAGDSEGVFYRFFPVEPGYAAVPREFNIAAVADAGGNGKVYRNIMSGTIPDRRPSLDIAGQE